MKIALIASNGNTVLEREVNRPNGAFPMYVFFGSRLFVFKEDHERGRVGAARPAAVFIERRFWAIPA